ncbi:hypothetical protein HPB49_005048 [Dermacentor silvarum]|uniref:Uncharacterized protein n=1 Tax=Dermacentor silvarum TaxID=543639 RepID=A0ACB8DB51_DERSI|nr:hypothetical protein HPB49_005048 [Dermacentor silvarum]
MEQRESPHPQKLGQAPFAQNVSAFPLTLPQPREQGIFGLPCRVATEAARCASTCPDGRRSCPGRYRLGSLVAAKDSRWLQLEVCREYQRNKCSRQDAECKFAHPPPNVEVQNGRVIACYDSIKVSQRKRIAVSRGARAAADTFLARRCVTESPAEEVAIPGGSRLFLAPQACLVLLEPSLFFGSTGRRFSYFGKPWSGSHWPTSAILIRLPPADARDLRNRPPPLSALSRAGDEDVRSLRGERAGNGGSQLPLIVSK